MGCKWNWRQLMSGVIAALSPTKVNIVATVIPEYAYGATSGAGNCISNDVTVTATGGVGTLTYAWTKLSGDTISATAATAATTAFTGTVGINEELGATFQCEIEDAIGTTTTVTVDVQLYEISYL